jgi:hypothetical protein
MKKEAIDQGMQVDCGNRKSKVMPPEPPEAIQPYQHLFFFSVFPFMYLNYAN